MAKTIPKKFVRVAIVLPTEFAYARGVLRGIIAATRERNMYATGGTAGSNAPWLFNVFRGVQSHSGRFLSRWFRDWRPDGIIGQIYSSGLASVYRATKSPVVELFETRRNSTFPRVLPDDIAAGEMAARHFLDRGFTHFGYFGVKWMVWSRERELGFRREIDRAFAARSLALPKGSTIPPYTCSAFAEHHAALKARGFRSDKERASAMSNWLASLPKPVAVFAANDLWGSELVQAARAIGLRVPDDVAILGVDNEELLCELAFPPLSSIRMGGEQIGRAAVNLLGAMMAGKDVKLLPNPRIAPVGVVTRQSTDVLAVSDPDVAAALRHIRFRACEGLSVKQLLNAIPVNRRTLERRFVSVLGRPPLDEIRRVRLDRAKTLLQTGMPVFEVAQRSGFRTPEYLATSFLQSTGMTPTEYRRQFATQEITTALPMTLTD